MPPDVGGGGGGEGSPATEQAWPLTEMLLGAPVPDVICATHWLEKLTGQMPVTLLSTNGPSQTLT